MNIAIIGLIGALAGVAGTYFAAVRKLSGSVSTSAADSLWEESSKIREWSAGQIDKLRAEVDKLQARLALVEEANEECRKENAVLIAENAALRIANEELHRRVGD